MAQLDFPGSPSNGQIFTPVAGGPSWQWDGTKWVAATTGSVAYAPINSPVFTGNPQAPQPPVGDADQSVSTTAFVAASTATALTNVGRNLIHNSMMNVQQRGTGSWATSGLYTADRWIMGFSGDTFTVGISPMPDAGRTAIGDEAAKFYLINTITGTAGAGSYSILQQPIEDVRRLAGKTVTLSFYANSSAGQKLGVSFDQYFGTGGSASASAQGVGQSVTLGTNWQRFSLTFAIPVISGIKTVGTSGNDSTFLNLWFSSGATNATRAGNVGVAPGGTVITLWGVQLEIGSVATPLEKLDPITQLQQCQRFYCTGRTYSTFYNQAGAAVSVTSYLPQPMRANPAGVVITTQASTNVTAPALNVLNAQAIYTSGTATATGPGTQDMTFTASADL